MAGESVAFPLRSAAKQQLGISHIAKDIDTDEQRHIQHTVPLATEIPVIDLRGLAAATEADLLQFRSALSSWGCFQAVNHGVESSLLDEVRRIAKGFFQLPLSEKEKYAAHATDGEDNGFSTNVGDVAVGDDQFPDWSDTLALRILPEDRQDPKYWPQNPESFRKVTIEYADKMREVETQILKVVAKSLSLRDEDSFVKKTGVMFGVYNYYPPCPNYDQVLGLRQHSDASVITILLPDDKVGGLQLFKDDTWLSVPIMPHALLILTGDQLEIMSNGIFKSFVHRAVRVTSEMDRLSLAMFSIPDFTEEIGPLDELVDGERPRLFKNVKNFVKFYYSYYHQGKRAIDELRI